MRKILVLGAGRSSSWLVKYLLDHAQQENWLVTIADASPELALQRAGSHDRARAASIDIYQAGERSLMISDHDIVVSLLPPSLHIEAARDCITHRKSLLTASYTSPAMRELHHDAVAAGITILNEIGLDPGIDHLSAIEMLDNIRDKGGEISAFRSYCGGLVAPEFENNPWKYKFTWNPMNVVLAGQATAHYLDRGKLHFIPPHRIFRQLENISLPGYGNFEAYANRDSLEYIEPYGLQGAGTILRGTLRRQGYCPAWDCLVQLGYTDNSYTLNGKGMTYSGLTAALLPPADGDLRQRLIRFLGIKAGDGRLDKLEWLGLLDEIPLTAMELSPAAHLLVLLEQKWKLENHEQDMIVMVHRINYTLNGKAQEEHSSLVVKGEDNNYTAMAKTVGLPLAMATRLILTGKMNRKGVILPVTPDIYQPLLKELREYDISFSNW